MNRYNAKDAQRNHKTLETNCAFRRPPVPDQVTESALSARVRYGSQVRNARIDDMDIKVLELTANAMYLGRALSLTNPHEEELNHRIKKAWAKFGVYRQELTDKGIPLQLRMKLFHSVITPTMLYGSASWVMTGGREQRLQSTQMKMLRTILARKSLAKPTTEPDEDDIESWVDWVRRVTAEASEAMKTYNIPDWVVEQREKVRRWGC